MFCFKKYRYVIVLIACLGLNACVINDMLKGLQNVNSTMAQTNSELTKTAEGMTATHGALTTLVSVMGKTNLAMDKMQSSIVQTAGLDQPMTALQNQMRQMQGDLNGLKTQMAVLRPAMEKLSTLKPAMEATAALNTPMRDVAALGTPMAQLAGLGEPMNNLNALSAPMAALADLKAPMEATAALAKPMTTLARLSSPLEGLILGLQQPWLIGMLVFFGVVLWMIATAAGVFLGIRLAARRNKTAE